MSDFFQFDSFNQFWPPNSFNSTNLSDLEMVGLQQLSWFSFQPLFDVYNLHFYIFNVYYLIKPFLVPAIASRNPKKNSR